MRRLDQMKLQMQAVDLLRLLHRRFSYRQLEELTGTPRSVLALYTTGVRVPTPEKAQAIIESILNKINPTSLLMTRINSVRGLGDWQELVLDPLILKITALWISRMYRGAVSKVLSAETVGVPLATAISLELEADLVLARRAPDDPRREYIRGEAGEPPFNLKTFYVQVGSIAPGDKVLLVDDLARTGMTLEALAKIVREAKAKAVAAVVMVALGREWRKRLEAQGIRELHAFIEIV